VIEDKLRKPRCRL